MEPVKPGYKTTEFWMAIVAKALVAALGALSVADAGFPAPVRAGAALLIPLIIAFLSKKYMDSRTEVKVAQSNAVAVANLDEAAAKLSEVSK